MTSSQHKLSPAVAHTEQNVGNIHRQYPYFPVDWAVAIRLLRLAVWHSWEVSDSMMRPWNINSIEYLILSILYGSEGHAMHAIELPGLIGQKPQVIGRMLQRLQKRGLIDRRLASDRRKTEISLSPAGLDLIEEILPTAVGLVDEQVKAFAPGELAELVRLLTKLHSVNPRIAGGLKLSDTAELSSAQ